MVAEKLNAAADPRAKLLRKRRWAFRLGVFFSLSAVFWVGVTAVLASWSTPVWALFIPSPIAVGAAFLATLALLRFRWLRGEPLPPQRSRLARRLPPWGSAARQPHGCSGGLSTWAHVHARCHGAGPDAARRRTA